MARPEASLWDYLRGLMPTGIHYSRIESETCPGFPDIHYTLENGSGTIELKSVPRTKAKFPFSGKKGLRKTQKDWICDEVAAGGFVLLILEIKPCIYAIRAEFYYDDLDRMSEEDISRVAVVGWERGDSVGDRLAVALVDW